MRDDDAQPIIDAILLIRGVTSVAAHVADPIHHMAVMQAKTLIREKIGELLSDE